MGPAKLCKKVSLLCLRRNIPRYITLFACHLHCRIDKPRAGLQGRRVNRL